MTTHTIPMAASADLYWLPLGAGGHVVRRVGQAYEWMQSCRERRQPRDLFHSALVVHLREGDFVIEQVPAKPRGQDRGVVRVGAVAVRWPSQRFFPHYEVHCWKNGVITDVAEAVESPVRVSSDEAACYRMLGCLADLPTPVWGRDELHTGEMWNSNSVTSWVLARSGVNALAIEPPTRGRAPGWRAGSIVESTPIP